MTTCKNTNNDLQRTPTFWEKNGIPIPESDLLDAELEFYKGEMEAVRVIQNESIYAAFATYNSYPDSKNSYFLSGFAHTLECYVGAEEFEEMRRR